MMHHRQHKLLSETPSGLVIKEAGRRAGPTLWMIEISESPRPQKNPKPACSCSPVARALAFKGRHIPADKRPINLGKAPPAAFLHDFGFRCRKRARPKGHSMPDPMPGHPFRTAGEFPQARRQQSLGGKQPGSSRQPKQRPVTAFPQLFLVSDAKSKSPEKLIILINIGGIQNGAPSLQGRRNSGGPECRSDSRRRLT